MLARVALLAPAVCYGVAVVVAGVVAALASGTTPGGEPGLGQALAVGIPLWLVAHLVPLQVTGVPLGVLPLTPAILLAALVAGVARGAVRRLGARPGDSRPLHGVLVPVVATAAAAHAVIGVLAAALLTPENVVDASPGLAGVTCGVLAGLAALAGVAGPCGVLTLTRRLPAWARQGLRGGLLAAAGLLTAGAALLLAALLADVAGVRDVFVGIAPEAGSGAGLTLLTAAYLPNAVVAATGWLIGPGVSIGAASATPIGDHLRPAAADPARGAPAAEPAPDLGRASPSPSRSPSAAWWAGACRPTAPDAATRVRSALVAAATAAVLLGLAAVLSGGRLGAGPFDPVVGARRSGGARRARLGARPRRSSSPCSRCRSAPAGPPPARRGGAPRATAPAPTPEVTVEPDEGADDAPSGDVDEDPEPAAADPDPVETAGGEGVGPVVASAANLGATSTPGPGAVLTTTEQHRLRLPAPARVVVLASGSGSLLQALLDAADDDGYPARVVAVVSDRLGRRRASTVRRAAGIDTVVVPPAEHADRAGVGRRAGRHRGRRVSPTSSCRPGSRGCSGRRSWRGFGGRTINTHPALLPAFPGAHPVRDTRRLRREGHRRDRAPGRRRRGHRSRPGAGGRDREPDDTEDTLHERIKVVERRVLVETVAALVRHGATVTGRGVRIP